MSKKYEIKTKMLQEQWLQPIIMFLLGQNLKIVIIQFTAFTCSDSIFNLLNSVKDGSFLFQCVSQKFPIWTVRPKLGISELRSRGVCWPALKAATEVFDHLENFGYFFDLHVFFFMCNSIFRVNVRVA